MLEDLMKIVENSEYTKGDIIDPKLVEHAKGVVLFNNKEYLKAIEHFEISASHNNYNSYYMLAIIYEHGLDVEEDLKKSFEYFLLASIEVPKAWKSLSRKYYNGLGTEINLSAAFDCYINSLNSGDESVLFNIGYMYYNGYGVDRNLDEALNYFTKAFYSGDKKATIALGKMYLNGEGTDINYDEAFKYLRLATQEGYGEAAFSLGVILENGLGLPSNNNQALKYYLQAEELGYSCYNIIEEVEKKISLFDFYYKKTISKIRGFKK